MGGGSTCAVCGNEIDPLLAVCPYCRQTRDPEYGRDAIGTVRVVNLEKGMPLVRQAMKRLVLEFESAVRSGCRVLVLIHGYGSSGRGGAIREAVRQYLQAELEKKTISDVLPGEKCGKRSGHAREIIKRFPSLRETAARFNPGITIVVI